ncbi:MULTISPECIES: maleylpyruvate isomerase family mycothiol-dependent enzyme [Nocardia]|uniref:Maleylpyruvate isomerase family mycothiol-dependent enzyme n=2 Tax=Nocardia TaxID=1817 RepID=A0A2T2Z1C9_9NOCA|nr:MULTISPECIES: maleylpyruvate isomerase family mycothiol-dependent enzyme [Nocardia]MBF6242031.1 maleylpyruvate isomerase family mycothiol-dependent enzyme [Nocardia elegans]MBF6447138.1 maleylpyruvate isomerase family mycothiol-dependent enzyme [Nocardia elegans]PSR61553.1 maleylpyruvate isomerase family mycothiol-dependent enzyme [Nocardia nova]
MSTASLDRAELTSALSGQWDVLAELTAGLNEDRWRLPSPLPGWTIFDVLAHVVGTESMLLGESLPQVDRDVHAFDHVRNDTGALNEMWLESLRPLRGDELLRRFTEVTDRRRAVLAAVDEAAWTADIQSPIGVVPYGRFMRVRLFDCWMHQLDITDALGGDAKALGMDEGGRRAEIALDEIEPFLGRVVVKRGGAPDGSRITIETTGPVARTVHIRVDGRADVVAALDHPADTVVRLSSSLFARLCGGRTAAADHRDEIEVDGDRALGERITANLAFTI